MMSCSSDSAGCMDLFLRLAIGGRIVLVGLVDAHSRGIARRGQLLDDVVERDLQREQEGEQESGYLVDARVGDRIGAQRLEPAMPEIQNRIDADAAAALAEAPH